MAQANPPKPQPAEIDENLETPSQVPPLRKPRPAPVITDYASI